MKGAKGGNRDRIISWLFSEKTRKKREEEVELKQEEIKELDEKRKEERKNKSKETKVEQFENIETTLNPGISSPTFSPLSVETSEDEKKDNKKTNDNETKPINNIGLEEDLDITLIDIFDTRRDKKYPVEVELSETEEKDTNSGKVNEENNKNDVDEENLNDSTLFPQPDIIELENTELIKISIIREIEEVLKNDYYELSDIKYQIDVLQQQEKDEVLLENIEKIQKELENLIKRFNYIKNKYSNLYEYMSIEDMELINTLGIGGVIKDYISNGKEGFDNSQTIDQINEIKEFIAIINNIIIIEQQKDEVSEKVEQKIEIFGIRDEEFIKMQDRYTKVEEINNAMQNYNLQIASVFADIEAKLVNNVDISKTIETTTSLIPDLNKIMEATLLMASTKLIPPTPIGQLFKASLFVSAIHMMANAVTPKTEQKEVITTTVTDYSRDINIGKDNVIAVLSNIENAFYEIDYMKKTFAKEFSQYASQIPEYDKLISNLFAIEKELTRQQNKAYEFSDKFDRILDKNNQKIKLLENE